MNGFIFATRIDNPKYGHDATGAFKIGAEGFKKVHNIKQNICWFDWHDKDASLRRQILHGLTTASSGTDGLDVVAYFGHGISNSLTSAGFYSKKNSPEITPDVRSLATAIIMNCKPNVRVVLYCCSAGELTNSFASALSSALLGTNAVVFGHTNAKHSYCNPYVGVFDANHMGHYFVTPYGQIWKPWVAELNKATGAHPEKHPLWAQYPFLNRFQLAMAMGLKDVSDIYAREDAM
jgi:hypothetical protein